MKNLVIPCAAPSGNAMPVFLQKAPDGRRWIERCLEGMDCDAFDRIVMTFLKEDIERWGGLGQISSVLDRRIEYCLLDGQTDGPASTVYQTVVRMGVSGSMVVKDADCSICSGPLPLGSDFVVGIDVESLSEDVPRLKDKSFIVLNEQSRIIDIAEKQLKSGIISLGLYGFADVGDFLDAYAALGSPSYGISPIFVSYCVSYLIGFNANYFTYVEAESFASWGSPAERRSLARQGHACGLPSDGGRMCVMVDLDGTLFDTDSVNFMAYSKALESTGRFLSRDDYAGKCMGRKYTDFLPDMYPDLSLAELEGIHEEKQRAYASFLGHASKNEVLVSFLREIKPTCGICLVTTASRRNALDLLERFGMLELFDGFVFGEDVEQGKPSPEAYLKAMDLMGADADRCIAIEDSEAGLASARAAGLLVAKVSWHAKGMGNE